MNIWTVLFIIANVANTIVMSTKGITVNTWQYWVSLILVCLIYVFGKFSN